MNLRIYDFFHKHALVRWASLVGITLVMLASILRLSYKEDIQDFLPIGEADRQRMAVYQDISGMNRLVVVFEETPSSSPSKGSEQELTQAIDLFVEIVEERDTMGWCQDLQATFDIDEFSETLDFVYQNIPLFLTDADYGRMDSLLATLDYMDARLEDDLNALMFPGTGDLVSQSIGRDPLGLFAASLGELQQLQGQMRFEMYDGYIFTPDMSRALVMLSSPFGSSETDGNAQLLSLLEGAIGKMQTDFPEVKAHVVGGPQIAVGNARQIMHDSILAVSLAAILILALLLYAFRRVRDIVLIGFSVLWGWLFALAGMAISLPLWGDLEGSVSMIVIGISSIIIGIAVNYPLHLVSHVQHQPDVRKAVREITKPLLVGNVTTVGAFLALVPLKSVALRDLGLFASFLLLGTILFVLVWLPHIVVKSEERRVKNKSNKSGGKGNSDSSSQSSGAGGTLFFLHSSLKSPDFLSRLASVQIERKKWLVVVVALLTIVFGYFSLSVKFDSDVSHINYMTEEQKADLKFFQEVATEGEGCSLYLLSSASDFDEALARSEARHSVVDSLVSEGLVTGYKGVNRFLPSKEVQTERISRWNEWVARHPQLLDDLNTAAARHGFSDEAFSDFADIIQSEYTLLSFDAFLPLTSKTFAGNISCAIEGSSTIVETLTVKKEDVEKVKAALSDAFDIASLHSSVADALSDDFNYIGWVCSSIVFLFLWLSFRRIELAVISFVPMAVSWIWILGIMSLLGINFNIVNIILATFIFGQGDDYTIFMTEGCISEYVHGKPMLTSYKRSIILSALIMFIGIGTLIFAKHPALHSLAEVTIIGMFSVVLMAYLIPPLLFKWMMRHFPKRFETL